MKYNRICQILGIEKPVIQGPLSWLTDNTAKIIELCETAWRAAAL